MHGTKIIFVTIGVGILIFALLALNLPQSNFSSWASLCFLIGLATAFFLRAWRLFASVQKGTMRRFMRVVRFTRKLLAVPPGIRFLYAAAWSIVCLSTAATLSGYAMVGRASMLVVFALLFAAGLADLSIRGTWLIRQLWTELLGKIFSISIGAVLVSLALIRAKTLVHSITHIDPKYFVESTAILAAFLLPIMYCLFGIALLSLLAILQIAGTVAISFAMMTAQHLGTFLGRANRARIRVLWYRVATGKRPPENNVPSYIVRLLDGISIMTKPMSTIAVIGGISMVYQALYGMLPLLQPYVTSTLVALEYRHGSSCVGLEDTKGLVYMEDGNVSVVRNVDNNLVFSVESCKFRAWGEGRS